MSDKNRLLYCIVIIIIYDAPTIELLNEFILTYTHFMTIQTRLNFQPRRMMVTDTFVNLPEALRPYMDESDVLSHPVFILIQGLPQSGKSHLLQALVNQFGGVYCPLGSLLSGGETGLVGYERPEMLAIDDYQHVIASRVWQQAINELLQNRNHSGKITIISTSDLQTQLSIKPHLTLTLVPLTKVQKIEAAQSRARFLGYKLEYAAAHWLVARYGHNLRQLMSIVHTLDEMSDHWRHPLTPKRLGMLLKAGTLPNPTPLEQHNP